MQYLVSLLSKGLGGFQSLTMANYIAMNILVWVSHAAQKKFLGILGDRLRVITFDRHWQISLQRKFTFTSSMYKSACLPKVFASIDFHQSYKILLS